MLNNKRILRIKMYFGISIFLLYNSAFEFYLQNHIVDAITVSISESILKKARPEYTGNFFEDYKDLCRLIFTDPRIHLCNDQSFPEVFLPNLPYVAITPKIRHSLIDNSLQSSLPSKYITLSMKVIYMNYDLYKKHQTEFFNLLNEFRMPIVLMGEKEIIQYSEYKVLGNFTLYPDCMTNLKNTIDLTYENGLSNNDVELFKKNMTIYNHASLNIFMGAGGIMFISLYASDNVLGICNNYWGTKYINNKNNSNIYVNDYTQFLAKLKENVVSS